MTRDRELIIDCDPGQDDAIAISVCKNIDRLKINGIVTVAGNNDIDNITNNARLLMQTLKSDIKIFKGSKGSLLNKVYSQDVHGTTGMDGMSQIPEINYQVEKGNFIDFYKETLKSKKITLVAIGPLTNIALLIKTYPDYIKNIEEIVIMGGGLQKGNVTDYAEFNFYADPEAAKIVFDSGIKITLFSLDVTEDAYLLEREYEQLKKGNYLAKAMFELINYYHSNGKKFGYTKCSLHDVCTILYLADLNIFEMEDRYIDISLQGLTRGMTLSNKSKEEKTIYNARVGKTIDRVKFKDAIINNILELDNKLYGKL